MPKTTPGRTWAYVGTVGGVTMSSLANLIQTYTDTSVPVVDQLLAAIFMGLLPVGLFISLEVLVRNRIKDHLIWWRVGMGIAATSFAIPSWLHMHWLLLAWGQGAIIADITPFGWDAVMLLSTLALLLPPTAVLQAEPVPAVVPESVPVVVPGVGEPIFVPEIREPVMTAKPPTRKSDSNRWTRPEDHPMHEEWLRRRQTPQPLRAKELAQREGSTEPAARSRLNRWAKTVNDDDSQPQPEVESSDREDAFV